VNYVAAYSQPQNLLVGTGNIIYLHILYYYCVVNYGIPSDTITGLKKIKNIEQYPEWLLSADTCATDATHRVHIAN